MRPGGSGGPGAPGGGWGSAPGGPGAPGGGWGPAPGGPWPGPAGLPGLGPGPGGFFGGVGNGLCNMISSCFYLFCCCWLIQDCFGGGPAPPGPFGPPGGPGAPLL